MKLLTYKWNLYFTAFLEVDCLVSSSHSKYLLSTYCVSDTVYIACGQYNEGIPFNLDLQVDHGLGRQGKIHRKKLCINS